MNALKARANETLDAEDTEKLASGARADLLDAVANPDFQTELGLFNVEINVPPARLRDRGLPVFEERVRRSLNEAEAAASALGTHLVMIGILPTLGQRHLGQDSMSPNPRYKLLSDQILAAREVVAPAQVGHGAMRDPHVRYQARREPLFRLAIAARGCVPEGEPLFAQVAPGNAASVRSVLAAGFRPIGSEVLFPRG